MSDDVVHGRPHSRTDAAGGAPVRGPAEAPGLDWALEVSADPEEVERALAARPRRAAPAAVETGELLRAVRFIDLTTLAGDDTPARVRALCERARHPLSADLTRALGEPAAGICTAAVCVYHHFLPVAHRALEGSGVPVAVAAGGFPAGLSPLRQRIDEVRAAADAGAEEIDAVINRSHVLTGEWEALHEEVAAFREASGGTPLKIILATGELGTLDHVARAARVCMLAGADFIKTSTGKEAVNATYPAGLVMLRAIRDYRERTGRAVGFKPAGGIRTPSQGLEWIGLVRAELGEEWLRTERFRIGASGLLAEIERRLAELSRGAPGEATAEGAGAGFTEY